MAEAPTPRFQGHWWKDRFGKWHRFDVSGPSGARGQREDERRGPIDDNSAKSPFPGWFKASDGRWRPPISETGASAPVDAGWPRRTAAEPPG